MSTQTGGERNHRFAIGLLAGTFVGVGLAVWFAPRLAAELRDRATDSAASLGRRASKRYQRASTRVGEAVGDLTRKGQDVRDNVADVVARGARQVEQYATAVKGDRSELDL